MLSIQNLKAKIDNKEILKGLNLKINAGEVHAIMGPNGSGKSTLSNILSGKKGYEIEGVVDFNNENLLNLETEERAHKGIFLAFQYPLEIPGVNTNTFLKTSLNAIKKAEEYLKSSGIGDKAFFGPEPEFFVFDDVRINNDPNNTGFVLDSKEGPYNSGKVYENGNMGHRPPVKGGYFPVPPVDSEQDMRGEYLKNLKEVGIKVEKHHHEVAPSQHELGMYFGTLVDQADNVQLYKYVVQMVTHSFGKTATFMPKPVAGDNGSGMHIHQSIWKGDTPVFSGDAYAGLSETALHYIGGILKHAKAINAFANSTTNSYKRLVPGFEAPVLLAYSARNRSASCRIPITLSKKGARCEIRFPDASGNPYLTFAAMLMAGLDGIKNKIHPGESFDKDLYELPPEEVKAIPTVCGSLREAMESLDKDREFLTQGGVFTDDQIDAYIALKFEEIQRFEHAPHPIEFEMYYSS
ncbi:type I glutamate--ammonia ligase [Candidatus Pelagibacter sp.]|nr:type I glutamate--ammonia ligase [Candidatus Pelagibacter sp.]